MSDHAGHLDRTSSLSSADSIQKSRCLLDCLNRATFTDALRGVVSVIDGFSWPEERQRAAIPLKSET